MNPPSNPNNFIQKFFYTEDKREGMIAFEAARRFMFGLAVYLTRSKLVIPLPVIITLGTIMFLMTVTDQIVNPTEANWLDKLEEYNIAYPAPVFSLVVVTYRRNLVRITEALDQWWHYPLLEEETTQVRKEAETFINRFQEVYHTFMKVGFFSYFMLPVGKYLYNGRQNNRDLLVFQCWSPIPLDNPWCFFLIFCFVTLCFYFPFFLYASIAAYKVTMTKLFSYQAKLMGVAIKTMTNRMYTMAKELSSNEEEFEQLYLDLVQQEIKQCASHFQRNYNCLKSMCHAFRPIANILYYSGMCVLVFCAMQFAKINGNPLIKFQAAFLLASVYVNQFLNSYITETLAEASEKFRLDVYDSDWYKLPAKSRKNIHLMQTMASYAPELTTYLGATCDKQFLAKVTNATYCYFNALNTMN